MTPRHNNRVPNLQAHNKKVGILYVDDTNLLAGLDEDDNLDSIGYKRQAAVSQWGRSLIARGGALNPDKHAIKYLQSSEAVKNLCLFACPDGSTDV